MESFPLPNELTECILRRLDERDFGNVVRVCKTWNKLSFLRNIDERIDWFKTRYGDRALVHMIASNNVDEATELVGELLEADDVVSEYVNAGMNGYDDDMRPIHYAVLHNNELLMCLLFETGCKIDCEARDEDGYSAVDYAAEMGFCDALDFMLHKRMAEANMWSEDRLTPLHHAVLCSQYDAVEVLTDYDVEFEVEDRKYGTPLQIAVANDDLKMVRLLLDVGAEPNYTATEYEDALYYKSSPLHLAKSLPVVEVLVAAGADTNVFDKYGRTPLHIAIVNGYTEIVSCMLEKGGASTQIQAPGYFTAMGALSSSRYSFPCPNFTKIYDMLLDRYYQKMGDHPAIVMNKIKKGGHTQFSTAVMYRTYHLVKRLVEYGGDVNMHIPGFGCSVMEYACQVRDPELMYALTIPKKRPLPNGLIVP